MSPFRAMTPLTFLFSAINTPAAVHNPCRSRCCPTLSIFHVFNSGLKTPFLLQSSRVSHAVPATNLPHAVLFFLIRYRYIHLLYHTKSCALSKRIRWWAMTLQNDWSVSSVPAEFSTDRFWVCCIHHSLPLRLSCSSTDHKVLEAAGDAACPLPLLHERPPRTWRSSLFCCCTSKRGRVSYTLLNIWRIPDCSFGERCCCKANSTSNGLVYISRIKKHLPPSRICGHVRSFQVSMNLVCSSDGIAWVLSVPIYINAIRHPLCASNIALLCFLKWAWLCLVERMFDSGSVQFVASAPRPQAHSTFLLSLSLSANRWLRHAALQKCALCTRSFG